jgi:hypothetical protein
MDSYEGGKVMATKIDVLQDLASEYVGDGLKADNLFFVTDHGVVVGVTRDFEAAYGQWKRLAASGAECALEDRQQGVLASVEPDDDGSSTLVTLDDTGDYRP